MTGTFLTKKETRHLHSTYALRKIKKEAQASFFILLLFSFYFQCKMNTLLFCHGHKIAFIR